MTEKVKLEKFLTFIIVVQSCNSYTLIKTFNQPKRPLEIFCLEMLKKIFGLYKFENVSKDEADIKTIGGNRYSQL